MKSSMSCVACSKREDDVDTIEQLFAQQIQSNATLDELQQALFLTNEALKLMEREKKQLAGVINKIKTAREFFKA